MLKQMSIYRLSDLKYSTFYTSFGRSIGSDKYRVIIQKQRAKKKKQPINSPRAKTAGHLESLPKTLCK